MDKKWHETTNFGVEIIRQTTSKEETWSRGTNLPLPFNVMLNLSIREIKIHLYRKRQTPDSS